MSYPTIPRVAAEAMPWGVQVRGDADTAWRHRKGSRKGELLGVLKRPIGAANECAAGDAITIQTDGHVLALVDGQPVSVILRAGKVA